MAQQGKNYARTQVFSAVLIALGIGTLLNGLLGILLSSWINLLFAGIGLIHLILFWKATVYVKDSSVEIRLGIGFILKSLSLEEIESCTVVRNRPRSLNVVGYGWGTRSFAVWPFYTQAIELSMTDGKRYRIGTDDPQKLDEFIQSRLKEEKRITPTG